MASARDHYDVVVVGAGHNGLTAAAYLARAGRSVLVLERLPHVGGAAVSLQAFPGIPVQVPRFASLVRGFPAEIVDDLGLNLRFLPRPVASYTPLVREGRPTGLLIEQPEEAATRASFRVLTGGTEEYVAWQRLHADADSVAAAVAPTLLQPLPLERQVRDQVDAQVWADLVARPIRETLEARLRDDTIRGAAAAATLSGGMAWVDDLAGNRAFLQDALGRVAGGPRLPLGGMGAVADALLRSARAAGAEVATSSGVSAIRGGADGAEVSWQDMFGSHTVGCRFALATVAPWVLEILRGSPEDAGSKPSGAMLRINLVVDRLPTLRSGVDPFVALGGTLRVAHGYEQLRTAYADAAAGRLPSAPPGWLDCPSFTDPTILGDLSLTGAHVLSYTGWFQPPAVFQASPETTRAEAVRRALETLDEHFAEPIMECVATDEHGRPCLEARIPQDIEDELALPGGHPDHGDLDWPWAPNRARLDTPAAAWGVQTDLESVLLAGAGARRGGGVSGIAGHNAARAVLAAL